ncbi:MAG: hypothetical protein LBC20_02635 [Planctomycetaceae bacterium]|jgi:hypothetical protein|nr:hypothetical protein [Planctomycetaceae bacterium]
MFLSFVQKNIEIFLFLLLFLIAIFLFGNAVSFAQREPVPSDPNAVEKPIIEESVQKKVMKKRNREGTIFQGKKVSFRQTGNRTTLYTIDDNERFICLENLNLERVLKAIDEKPTRTTWKIDGEFTEFRGENYILIRRAVIAQENVPALPTAPNPVNPANPASSTGKKP